MSPPSPSSRVRGWQPSNHSRSVVSDSEGGVRLPLPLPPPVCVGGSQRSAGRCHLSSRATLPPHPHTAPPALREGTTLASRRPNAIARQIIGRTGSVSVVRGRWRATMLTELRGVAAGRRCA
jgi:hypothetical protein